MNKIKKFFAELELFELLTTPSIWMLMFWTFALLALLDGSSCSCSVSINSK